MNTIEKLDKKSCTGCGACFNICPKNAISMEKNSEGFLEPVVDHKKCIDCGLCEKVCPQLASKIKLNKANHTYGIKCKDKIRENCSSGGVFGAVAKWAISKGGSVFGATFTEDYQGVVHVKAKTEDELEKLYKSKYMQSDTGLIFKEVKQELEKSKAPVIFAGCPCQVSGLKSFLMKDYDNLFTIDILCHGVASPEAYRLFLKEFFGDVESPIKNVDFRSKRFGWACNVAVVAEDGTERVSPHAGDYFNAFLWGYSQRNVCFDCKYANQERIGDITIGDFWGIDKILPKLNDKKGVSLVLSNTEKGTELIKEIKTYIDEIEECDYGKMLDAVKDINWALYKPGIKPTNRDVFFYRLSRGDTFSQALRYASSPKYDVGIFGWWFEDQWTNYGSTLTYYALMEYVSSLGLSVCMITSPFHKRENASEFVKKHGYMMSPTYSFADFAKHNENIDTFLIGSDQLWFYHCYKTWGHSLFLDFVNDDKKKISYATSFGHKDPKIPDSELPKVKKLLERFDAISNREFDGVDIMAEKFGIESVQNVDPVFLCDMKNWESIANDAERKTEGDYIFTYMLDPNEEKTKVLKHLSKKLGLKIVSVTDKQYENNEKVKLLKNFGVIENATIPEQIYHLMNAKYVVTDSYHGTCFSVLFKKNFVAMVNAKRGTSRFDTIGKLFGVADRFVFDPSEVLTRDELLVRPDYSKIEPKMKKAIEKSKAWLNNQLLSKKQPKIEKKEEKKEINITQDKIKKDFRLLHHLGYNVGRWLRDNKITNISVYCKEKYLDIFEEFLLSHQIDNIVKIEGFYSDKTFEFKHAQSINFGVAYFQKGLPSSGVLLYISDELDLIDAPNCKVLNLLSVLWKALLYASVYRPIMVFKEKNPNVNILCVNYPLLPPPEKRDERESLMFANKKDYDYGNIKNTLPRTFDVFKDKSYSHETWTDLFRFASSEIDIHGNRIYLDYSSEFKNIRNGHRITYNQPENAEKTLFMLGGCVTFGYGCSDADTSSSKLQKLLNNEKIDWKVENYGSFLTHRKNDMYTSLFNLPVKSGDVVVIQVWSNLLDICKNNIDFLDLKEVFYRPHNYGDVFIDSAHPSHIGQEVMANKIFEHIKSKKFYKDVFGAKPNIDVEPLPVFGVPKEFYSWGGDEFSHPELNSYLDSLKTYRDKIGAIVMNCNPFTLGHRYLIEKASKLCKKLFVFVVEEDKSIFKFSDRFELVKKGTADLKNVVVLPSGKFMISSLTFTDYFNKSKLQDKQIDPSMDVEIFAKHIAPAVGVNVRFVGEEPLDKVTKQYNDTMRRILPKYGIDFYEIPRKEEMGGVISASRVRKLLEEKKFAEIKKLVPKTTLDFLIKNFK